MDPARPAGPGRRRRPAPGGLPGVALGRRAGRSTSWVRGSRDRPLRRRGAGPAAWKPTPPTSTATGPTGRCAAVATARRPRPTGRSAASRAAPAPEWLRAWPPATAPLLFGRSPAGTARAVPAAVRAEAEAWLAGACRLSRPARQGAGPGRRGPRHAERTGRRGSAAGQTAASCRTRPVHCARNPAETAGRHACSVCSPNGPRDRSRWLAVAGRADPARPVRPATQPRGCDQRSQKALSRAIGHAHIPRPGAGPTGRTPASARSRGCRTPATSPPAWGRAGTPPRCGPGRPRASPPAGVPPRPAATRSSRVSVSGPCRDRRQHACWPAAG